MKMKFNITLINKTQLKKFIKNSKKIKNMKNLPTKL